MRDFPVLRGNGSSLWDVCLGAHRDKLSEEVETSENTLVFVGSKQGGKTTLFYEFQGSNDAVKPTMALEYRYIRKSGRTGKKDVCHVWELGGGTLFERLLSSPLSNLSNVTMIIVLDLSSPETLWFTLETLLQQLRTHIKQVISKTKNLKEKLSKEAWKRVGEDHVDKEYLDPFPIPLVILGSKYDIFQDFDPDSKKLMCRSLRFLSHINGGTLQYYSCKDAGLVKKAKLLLHHHAFNTAYSKMIAQDYNQPLLITAGSDTLQQIGATDNNINVWKHAYVSKFPQPEKEQSVIPEDPSRDPTYAEPEIDSLRSQKLEELELYRRESDLVDRMQNL